MSMVDAAVNQEDYAGLGAREGSARGGGNVGGRIRLMNRLGHLSGTRLLDIGCGNGAYTMRLAESFESAVGVDLEPDRISDFEATLVERDLRIEVLLRSAADLPHPDGHFHVVTAIETMEHLAEHLHPVLAEVARVTAPGGSFYLTTPNRWWPFEQHGFVWRGRRYPGLAFPFLTWLVPIHRRLSDADAFVPSRLDSLIEPHGFRRIGLTRMWPPLDSHPTLARRLRPLRRLLDLIGLGRFAQTLVMRYDRTV